MMVNDDPAEVLAGELYVGSAYATTSSVQFNGIVNCAHEVRDDTTTCSIPILRLEWREVSGELLEDVSNITVAFIQRHKPVLVKCAAGRSRSVSVCLWYLMVQHHMSLSQAFVKLAKKRPCAEPNADLWQQLQKKSGERPPVTLEMCRAKARDAIRQEEEAQMGKGLKKKLPSSSSSSSSSSFAETTIRSGSELESLMQVVDCGGEKLKRGWQVKIEGLRVTSEQDEQDDEEGQKVLKMLLQKMPRHISMITLDKSCIISPCARKLLMAKCYIVLAK